MNWWAERNADVDERVKKFALQCHHFSKPQTPIHLLHEHWSLSINGTKNASIAKNDMHESILSPRTLHYWKNHHNAPISDINHIEWDSGAAAIRRLTPSKRRWAAKFATGFIGNNHMRTKRGEIVSPTCPLCNSIIEKTCHILCCPNVEATTFATETTRIKIREVLVPSRVRATRAPHAPPIYFFSSHTSKLLGK